jgi:dihydroorotate dehydrogenase (NAD+) catalytic subunit
VDVETRRPKLAFGTGGLSGPAIRPVAVRMAWQAARAVKIPVIGIGGISSAMDALEFLIAGCRAVQVGTANFVDPGLYSRLAKDLQAYLDRHGLTSVDEVIGTLDYPGLGPTRTA